MSTKKHTIYVINTADNGKSYWNRAGVAFENKDGSFTFKLDVFPQTKFQLREERPFANEVMRRALGVSAARRARRMTSLRLRPTRRRQALEASDMLFGKPHGESMFQIPHRMSIGIAVTLSSGNRFTRANKPKALSALPKCPNVDVTDVRARHLQFCWQTKLFLAPTSWVPCCHTECTRSSLRVTRSALRVTR